MIRLVQRTDREAAAREIAEAPRVAIDTEFHAERRYRPRLYLVQVHVPGATTWLFDPLVSGLLEHAAEALRSVPWVVHGSAHDLPLLAHALGGLPTQVFDTQIAAGLVEAAWPTRLGVLCARWIGVDLPKAATLTDWSQRPLAEGQIRYAADDVVVLPALADTLATALERRGRVEISALAHAEALARALDPPGFDRVWTELPGAATLPPLGATVLQELAEWRERVAQDANQPPHALIPNGVLFDLARNVPATARDLAANRRFPKKILETWGPELMERIEAARRRPEWGRPRIPQAGSAAARRSSWIEVVAQAIGEADGFGWRLALPPHVRDGLALLERPDREAVAERCAAPPSVGGWRDHLIGEAMTGALDGSAALRLVEGELSLTGRA